MTTIARKLKFRRSAVTVVRFYDVQCDVCNGSASEELYRNRQDAEDSRRAHIAWHEREDR